MVTLNKKDNFFKKYRWFFTKSGKLVYGGKSAEQNEEVVKDLIKRAEKDMVVMHTALPGSPFAIIDCPLEKVNPSDLEECAIWCGSFSRAWREGKKEAKIDIFTKNKIFKDKSMKSGTFGVTKKTKSEKVKIELYLVKQKGVLRAVPKETLEKGEGFARIIPGKISKDKISEEISKKLKVKNEEVLNALPTGKFSLHWET